MAEAAVEASTIFQFLEALSIWSDHIDELKSEQPVPTECAASSTTGWAARAAGTPRDRAASATTI